MWKRGAQSAQLLENHPINRIEIDIKRWWPLWANFRRCYIEYVYTSVINVQKIMYIRVMAYRTV